MSLKTHGSFRDNECVLLKNIYMYFSKRADSGSSAANRLSGLGNFFPGNFKQNLLRAPFNLKEV